MNKVRSEEERNGSGDWIERGQDGSEDAVFAYPKVRISDHAQICQNETICLYYDTIWPDAGKCFI